MDLEHLLSLRSESEYMSRNRPGLVARRLQRAIRIMHHSLKDLSHTRECCQGRPSKFLMKLSRNDSFFSIFTSLNGLNDR